MKRTRRLTLSRCDGRRRRRISRMLRRAFYFRDGAFRGGQSHSFDHPEEIRDARRLAEAGIVTVVGHEKEVRLFFTPADAKGWFGIRPFGRSWGGLEPWSGKKRLKKGTDRRALRREEREWQGKPWRKKRRKKGTDRRARATLHATTP